MGEVRFTRSARKHRIGVARALAAMEDRGEPWVIPATEGMDERLLFIGNDGRGLQLEVIAIQTETYLLVIHVVPFNWRRRSR